MGTLVVALKHVGLVAPKVCRILVPQSGIEPMSPALQGEFLTTSPPGKSLESILEGPALPHPLAQLDDVPLHP